MQPQINAIKFNFNETYFNAIQKQINLIPILLKQLNAIERKFESIQIKSIPSQLNSRQCNETPSNFSSMKSMNSAWAVDSKASTSERKKFMKVSWKDYMYNFKATQINTFP